MKIERKYWIYRIRQRAKDWRTEAIYIGLTNDLDGCWEQHRQEIERARAGKASEWKYGYLSLFPATHVQFEKVCDDWEYGSARTREAKAIARLRKEPIIRSLNAVKEHERGGPSLIVPTSKRGLQVLCRKGYEVGNEVVAATSGSTHRSLLRLTHMHARRYRDSEFNSFGFEDTGYGWEVENPLSLQEPVCDGPWQPKQKLWRAAQERKRERQLHAALVAGSPPRHADR